MYKTILKIKRIEIQNFNPKEAKADLNIIFDKNNVEKSVIKPVLLREPMKLVELVLLAMKSEGKFIVEEESDDILSSIYITRVADEEEIEEKMLPFFKNLCEKAIKLKNTKLASQYMQLFNEIKVMKLVF